MIETSIKLSFAKAFLVSFGDEIALDDINIQKTRPEIEGDFTINIFPFVKYAKKSPQETAKILGNEVQKTLPEISSFNVIFFTKPNIETFIIQAPSQFSQRLV